MANDFEFITWTPAGALNDKRGTPRKRRRNLGLYRARTEGPHAASAGRAGAGVTINQAGRRGEKPVNWFSNNERLVELNNALDEILEFASYPARSPESLSRALRKKKNRQRKWISPREDIPRERKPGGRKPNPQGQRQPGAFGQYG